MHVCMLSHFSQAWLFATLWAVARQSPLFMGFSSQEHWSGFAIPFSRGSSWPRDRNPSPVSPASLVDSSPLSHWGSPLLPNPGFLQSWSWANAGFVGLWGTVQQLGIKRPAFRAPQEGVRNLTAWGGGDNYQEERWWGRGVPQTCQGGKGELKRRLPGPLDLPLGGLRRKGSSNTLINILCTVVGFHLKLLQLRCYKPILVSQKARLFLHLEGIILFSLFLK